MIQEEKIYTDANMRSVTMAEATGSVKSRTQSAVDPGYRTSMEILTRRGGIFWGLVLLVVGLIWLAAAAKLITIGLDLVIPFLVVVAGLYLLVTKAMQ